ncbi:MAG: ATP-dependent DNA helicase RecG [Lachnospiraceae bacterium]|nr:ATP-dependent DNA helicase RecG [Lachnospiraceae bacterium]
MQIGSIKGVGEKTEALFHKIGVYTAEDLLRYYPVHYLEYAPPKPVFELAEGELAAFSGVLTAKPGMRKGQRMTIMTAKVSDMSGSLQLIWFNAPYIASQLKAGGRYVFYGRISVRGKQKYMEHPEIFTPADYEKQMSHLKPVYSLTKGLSNKTIIRILNTIFSARPRIDDWLPDGIRTLYGLKREDEAVKGIHFPESQKELSEARNRLVFDELFLFVLAMRTLKGHLEDQPNSFPMKKTWDTEETIEKLPYRLTGAQTAAWHTIEKELSGEKLMNRLIQGDVGSGKTILAFLAMQMAASNGYQSVLMAPTEVLASQHYEKLCSMRDELKMKDVRPALLIGSLKAREKNAVREAIAKGEVNCIIGTQALIQEGVSYRDLSLMITDEQHRFGVRQRKALAENGPVPNMMVMSATPIPRTLGIIFYGDLDITVIDEKPKMQMPVKNALVDRSWRPNAYRFIKKQLDLGRQAYIVCAMVEPSEELDVENVTEYVRSVRKAFPDHKAAALHGQMKAAEKEKIMASFAAGEIDILVATTVIEVGVDVPNATVMMIEDAERFGLATLHQLRGRVGRGAEQSYCIFVQGHATESSEERLGVLSSTNDGFVIAEKDFELRGPGDLLGIRQSGDLYFTLSDIGRDREILRDAGQVAANIMEDDPDLTGEEYADLKAVLSAYIRRMEGNIVL